MPKLPQVSGAELIRLLQSLGYEVVRQRGSHIRLKKITVPGEHAITIPAHKVIAKARSVASSVEWVSGITFQERNSISG